MEEKLREEFQAFADSIVWQNDDGSEKYIAIGNMADWWISKLTETLDTLEKEVVEDYSEWLYKHGYIDSDYYTEEPKAIDKYLSKLKSLRDNK